MILATRITFIIERSWKYIYFHSKMAWPPATYDVLSVTIETDRYWTYLNMCLRDKQTATENVRCWCFILQEKTQP